MAEEQDIWERKKVCIIDDNEDIRSIYQTKFSAEGFEVFMAVNGEEGLKVINQAKPDIILLDIEMPIMNGIEVLKKLREDTALSRIPVIMLTNQDSEDSFRTVGKFDTQFYIIKSLATPQKVVNIVREVLRARR
ncbi:MAG: response regulator [Candidatus Moranbacteria bacterium]|nr:response regulator [Candidatus Moranbacteria bacterium]MDD3965307.1 response regulator [Candidatus Moranbacteria bacterium]